MASKKNHYKQLEQYLTIGLILDALLFIGFLISAGNGIIWLKVILFILTLFVSGLCLYMLYASQELLRPRSLWMTVAALAVIVCSLASLLLNFPSPKPVAPESSVSETVESTADTQTSTSESAQ